MSTLIKDQTGPHITESGFCTLFSSKYQKQTSTKLQFRSSGLNIAIADPTHSTDMENKRKSIGSGPPRPRQRPQHKDLFIPEDRGRE